MGGGRKERYPCPTCTRQRRHKAAVCDACWELVPLPVRRQWWATRPGTVARHYALLDVLGCIIGPANRERRRAPHMTA